jgi:hypothetical protein
VSSEISSHQRQPRLGDSGIQPINGVLISYAEAVDVVGVIDELAIRCAPKVLLRRVVAIRQGLIECCTRANTYGDTSAEVIARQDVLALDPSAVIDVKTAAERLDMTPDGARWLCTHGRLTARKIHNRWWIDSKSVDQYQIERKKD